jgi:hypothetical protein
MSDTEIDFSPDHSRYRWWAEVAVAILVAISIGWLLDLVGWLR